MKTCRVIAFLLLLLVSSSAEVVATTSGSDGSVSLRSGGSMAGDPGDSFLGGITLPTLGGGGVAGDPGNNFIGGINNPPKGSGVAGDPGNNFISSDGPIGDNLYFLLLLVALYGTMDWIRKKNKRKTVK